MNTSKKMLVFLHNTRKVYPDPDNTKSYLQADGYDPETIRAMVGHFENLGLEVMPVEADERAYLKLYKYRKQITIAWNDSEGTIGADREAQMPAMLEMLGIPYTTSSPLTQALVLNKVKTKEILEMHSVPVLPSFVYPAAENIGDPGINYPVIVKPIGEGSSAGITNNSVVSNLKQLKTQVELVVSTFKEPALAEPLLTGREFSIAMLGNPPQILPIIESDHGVLPEKYAPIDSMEVKWYLEEESPVNNLVCPAVIDKKLEEKIKQICLKTWSALGIRDLCRIDVRCDHEDHPYVLEVNSPPGMIPPEVSTSSYFPLAARAAGIDYETLLKIILTAAAERYPIKLF
jgi:D-alanine-D-alanine ligase